MNDSNPAQEMYVCSNCPRPLQLTLLAEVSGLCDRCREVLYPPEEI